jgi:hypothetical protein
MKKIFAALLLVSVTGSVFAQSGVLDKAKSTVKTAQAAGLDVNGIATSILGKLSPALSLTETQKPNVLTAVTGFLKDKSGIMGLANTDKAGYASKFAGLQGGLFKKLKTLLTVAQYTKFLGLKPKTNDATNALSQLFF